MTEYFRRYHRYPVFTRAVVTLKEWAHPRQVTTQVTNISQGGIGLYTDVPLEQTTPVSVELAYPDIVGTGPGEHLQGRVASLLKQYDRYFMGIVFDEPLTHEHLMKILRWE
ncbi:MAG: PilZ domain-containing protein [bacterium]